VDKAAAMLLKCLEWRKETDVVRRARSARSRATRAAHRAPPRPGPHASMLSCCCVHTATHGRRLVPRSIFSRPLSVPKFRHMARYFPHAHHGFDKQGQPIYIDRTGLLDVESVLELVSKEEVLHSHIIMMEYQNRILMAEGSRRVGHTVHRMCNIVDMTGCAAESGALPAALPAGVCVLTRCGRIVCCVCRLAARRCAWPRARHASVHASTHARTHARTHPFCARARADAPCDAHIHTQAMDVFKLIAAVDQDNYPETMGATFVVNAPWVFTAVWRMVRVFLDEGVTAKVHILAEGAPTRDALLQAVDADVLPAFLGGNCSCAGGCVSGESCTSPDGLVASQRAIQAYCYKYTEQLEAGLITEDGRPAVKKAAPAALAPVAAPVAAPAARVAAPAPAPAAAAAPAARAPPAAARAAAPAPLAVRVPAAPSVPTHAAAEHDSPRHLERNNAFRKPLTEPPLREPPAPANGTAGSRAAASASHDEQPHTPGSECASDDAAAAAAAAAEAIAAAAVAASAARDAAAARAASLQAEAAVAVAVADARAADDEARAAAKMAHCAAEEARAAARVAAAAASALQARVAAGASASAASSHAPAPAAAASERPWPASQSLRRSRRESGSDADEDAGAFSDALESLDGDDDDFDT
jgi:hypothetical protein